MVTYETNCIKGESYPTRFSALKKAHEVKKDIERGLLRQRVDWSTSFLIQYTDYVLKRKGYPELADELTQGWSAMKYQIYRREDSLDGVGDHPSQILSMWLAREYFKIEFYLGRDFCVSSHIFDLQGVNSEFKIVVHPHTFPMDSVHGDRCVEYKRHFAGRPNDEVYPGLVPILTYWSVMGGMTATGIPWVGGLVASVGEDIMERHIAPGLSDRICSQAMEVRNDAILDSPLN